MTTMKKIIIIPIIIMIVITHFLDDHREKDDRMNQTKNGSTYIFADLRLINSPVTLKYLRFAFNINHDGCPDDQKRKVFLC